MLNIIQGDLLSVNTGIIAHGCNVYGRMGAGVALAVKRKWPKCYTKYKEECVENALGLGDISWYPAGSDLYIANCITQLTTGDDGKRHASYDAIEDTLTKVFKIAKNTNLDVSLPWIGCGLGGCNKNAVKAIIDAVSDRYEVFAHIYEL